MICIRCERSTPNDDLCLTCSNEVDRELREVLWRPVRLGRHGGRWKVFGRRGHGHGEVM